jgi:FMNH2-dependent dimethyl sulfone monooxygenase
MERSVADRTMRIGLFYPHTYTPHIRSYKVRQLVPDVFDLEVHRRLVTACETGGLDFLFTLDNWGVQSWGGQSGTSSEVREHGLMGPILAAALFGMTRSMPFITTVHTSILHPVHVARIGANLDTLSRGRWGVNLVTGSGGADGLFERLATYPNHDERYLMAEEAFEIITQLWRGERCDFAGKYYRVQGELIGPTVIQQPYPAIVTAGASAAGLRFTARYADWHFMPGRMAREDALARIDRLGELCQAEGRPADDIRIMRHVSMLVRDTAQEAQEATEWLLSLVDRDMAHRYIEQIGQRISTYREVYQHYARDDDTVRRIGLSSGALLMHGTPAYVAEQIQVLHDTQACGGIALTFPLWHTEEIERFTQGVLPLLEQMGIWISPHRRGWSW